MQTLHWLGMDWDEPSVGPQANPLVQSLDLEPYRAAMRQLARSGFAYPCELSRSQIEAAASAPQDGAHDVAFPRELRPAIAGQSLDFDAEQAGALERQGEGANWRLRCPDRAVEFVDRVCGPQRFVPAEIIGDFVLWTKRNQPSYQLAVVVDDMRQGVTDVVRGADLLDSAARQMLLYECLGYGKERAGPQYWHLPLVLGPDGRRLAKRHGDSRVDFYRGKGVRPEAIIGLMGHWCVPGRGLGSMTAHEFVQTFESDKLPGSPVTFTPEIDQWLLSTVRSF